MSNFSLFLFSLLLLILIFLIIFNFHKQMWKLKSIMWSYIVEITTHVKWGCEFLIENSFFYHRTTDINNNVPELSQKLKIRRQRKVCSTSEEEDEAVECAVCLNRIEEEEEIRELRCDHLFHRACLDRWVGYEHVTCPLCRVPLFSPIMEFFETQITQLVVFQNFTSFTSTERDTWWLR
ncbi:hypothetical protein Ddye_030715 [Dipteronia dyeriana]|uniref:RING-type domain-containing protein n=1 Tax=Dipteronia dyeriana TaxID=168575 RepID=A0AAD9THG4_9ROSI|nr:hypothetical protein Ddye_030715 [Dipteronia dyeriana]